MLISPEAMQLDILAKFSQMQRDYCWVSLALLCVCPRLHHVLWNNSQEADTRAAGTITPNCNLDFSLRYPKQLMPAGRYWTVYLCIKFTVVSARNSCCCLV